MTSKGWRTPVQYDGKGFVDLVLVHQETGRLIFAELKSDRGKLSPEQEQWVTGLQRVAEICDAVEVYVWSPTDWPARITHCLTGRDVVKVA